MAARLEAAPTAHSDQLVDLRRVSPNELSALLAEESAVWREDLEWDFEKSADLVRRFVEMRALNGCALLADGEVAGYAYYVVEEHKGLVGDVYVRRRWAGEARQNAVLEWVLAAIRGTPAVRRIEAQLMLIDAPPPHGLPMAPYARAFERNFMRVDLERAALGPGQVRRPMYLEHWTDQYQDGAAQLIAAAYAGHVDSSINDQYRSPAGARRFLYNIVQYPGCGTFFKSASTAAFDASTGRMVGICLASLVAFGCGHITQLCVAPSWRGTGAGHELMRQSLLTLKNFGCRAATLTVTASNQTAVELYERMGFVTKRKFSAYVWEGF